MRKNKKSLLINKALIRTLGAVLAFLLIVLPIGKVAVKAFFGEEETGIVDGLLYPVEGGECLQNFDDDHKAVDIIEVDCGTIIRAACDGRLQSAGPGLSGDSVFGGTSRGGEMGLLLNNLENCKDDANDWSDYGIFYGCIDFSDTSTRPVKQGYIIGTVGECEEHEQESAQGCHIHFVLVEGALGGDGSVGDCGYLHMEDEATDED